MRKKTVVAALLLPLLVIGLFQPESHGMDRGNSPGKTMTYGAMKISNNTGKDMTSIKIGTAGVASWDQDLITLISTTELKNGKSYAWNSVATGNKDITFTFSDNTTKHYNNKFHVSTAQRADLDISSAGLNVTYVQAGVGSGSPNGYTCSKSYSTTCSSCAIFSCECNTTGCSDGYYDADGIRYAFNTHSSKSVYNAAQQAIAQCCK